MGKHNRNNKKKENISQSSNIYNKIFEYILQYNYDNQM